MSTESQVILVLPRGVLSAQQISFCCMLGTKLVRMDEEYLVHGTEGTYHFFSPEMCARGYCGHDGRRADIWATGVCVWAFLLGTLPYWHQDLAALMDCIAFEELPQPGRCVETDEFMVVNFQIESGKCMEMWNCMSLCLSWFSKNSQDVEVWSDRIFLERNCNRSCKLMISSLQSSS